MSLNTDPQQYYDLLTYYRSKISEFEQERLEWLTKVEEIRIQYEDKHQLEWELLKRKDEINELQQSLSEAKVMLFEERQARVKLQRDNDNLKVKELEDRKKIAELLAMLDPVSEQVVLTKDLRPEVTTKYQQENLQVKNKMHQVGQGKTILKTVYMPNEQLNAASLENENLKKQLEAVNTLLTQQFAALREEIRIKELEYEQKRRDDTQKIDSSQGRLQKLEKQNVELVKGILNQQVEYYNLKQKYNHLQKQSQEEQEVLKLKNQKLKMEIDNLSKQTQNDSKAAQSLMEKKSEEYTKKFRTQIKSKDEQLNIIKEQYQQVQTIYIDKIRQLEDNLSKLIEKFQTLEKRRALEVEGYKNDIKNLTQKKNQEIDLFKTDIKKLSARLKDYEGDKFDDVRKNIEEPEIIKQQKETAQIYSSGKKNQTLKQQPKTKKFTGTQTLKQQQQKQQQSPSDDNVSESMPLQELEDIQRQLDELERQMDQARKN